MVSFLVSTGMPKEKYEPPDPRRIYTIMSSEEAANGKKSHWVELEISGKTYMDKFMIWKLKSSNANTQGKQCFILPMLICLRS